MEQEYRELKMQLNPAKKRVFQEKDNIYQDEYDSDYDNNKKRNKYMMHNANEKRIGPIFFNTSFPIFNQDPKQVSMYCESNFQNVSHHDSSNDAIIDEQWQNRIGPNVSDDKRKWLENMKKRYENEMYFYRREQKSYESKDDESTEYYK